MAAYCRVSTDQLEQLSSYEAQVNYYTNFINGHSDYEFAGIYADEGISGTNTKKREQFNKMIEACKAGEIEMIITKSISRFARNTLDTLNYVRLLKDLGIGVLFEKENINTLDSKGEVLLTILSSLAQDESRSISENSTWGIRRKFEQGKVMINHKAFLGYDKDEEGNLVIDEKEAKIVRMIYTDYLNGKSPNRMAREYNNKGIKNCRGKVNWHENTIRSILKNEKYKGDAILQKTYTVDFLTKKRIKNEGDVPQYYVEDSHEAIIEKEVWEAVQLETQRRKDYTQRHGLKRVDFGMEDNPMAGKIVCGHCGRYFGRRLWNANNERLRRRIWQCSRKYEVKGEINCDNKHIDDTNLQKVFVNTYNAIIENKDYFMEKWTEHLDSENVLQKYKAKQFINMFETAEEVIEFESELFFSLIEKMTIFGADMIIVSLLDGTEVEVTLE